MEFSKGTVAPGVDVVWDKADDSPFPMAVRAGDLIYAPNICALSTVSSLGELEPATLEVRHILDRLASALGALGSDMGQLLFLQQYVAERDQTTAAGRERIKRFVGGYPASTAIGVRTLSRPGSRVQMDFLATSAGQPVTRTRDSALGRSFSDYVEWAGFYFFAGVTCGDQDIGIDHATWFAAATRATTSFLLERRLKPLLKCENLAICDIVLVHAHLRDVTRDFASLVGALLEQFPDDKRPALMVSQADEMQNVNGRMEITAVAASAAAEMAVRRTKTRSQSGVPRAVCLGRHCHLSTMFPVPASMRAGRTYFENEASRQIHSIIDQAEDVLGELGMLLNSLIRLRFYISDPSHGALIASIVSLRVGTTVSVSLAGSAAIDDSFNTISIYADATAYAPEDLWPAAEKLALKDQ